MKIPIQWLSEYINITASPHELAQMLTMSGTEVSDIINIGENWKNVVVGKVIEVVPHPNSDHLNLATIDFGGENITVVCGAPNITTNIKVPFAQVGAVLYDADTKKSIELKAAKIRGVVSRGMICSERELGISDNHEGIMILPDGSPIGMPLHDLLGDTILDLEITPNRPDCLSILGIAREVSALTEAPVRIPMFKYKESASLIDEHISVDIAAPDLCYRYCASLITDIKVGPSPEWMQQRLIKCGVHPINNIVDVTNYVMLEYGQPLHAFDYNKITTKKIVVRRARKDETITSLDGIVRQLKEDMLTITDGQKPIAIAGIMGGLESEITEDTTSVLLEAANFNSSSIRSTANQLNLHSEASLRYERRISRQIASYALIRATQLFQELAGGKVARGTLDIYPSKIEKVPILISTAEVKSILGVEFDITKLVHVLNSLGFECQNEDMLPQVWVIPPYWRSDINSIADLIEEIARIIGYDRVPPRMLGSALPHQQPIPATLMRELIRDILTGCGSQEILSHSLTSMDMLQNISSRHQLIGPEPIRIINPMTKAEEYLRTSLLPGLLTILSNNQRHEDDELKFFEIGKIYLPRAGALPYEHEILAGVFSRARVKKHWLTSENSFNFFDVKGLIEVLSNRTGINISFKESSDERLYPGRGADIIDVSGNNIGILGEIHPQVAKIFDIEVTSYLMELDLYKLPYIPAGQKYHALNRYPAVIRDIAIIVDKTIPAVRIKEIVLGFPLVSELRMFDLYTGKQIPEGKKSLAYRIVYQSSNHTLTDDEVNKVHQQILNRLSEKLQASLR